MPVPGSIYPTLAEVKTKVTLRGYESTTALLEEAINDAYSEVLAAKRWPFLSARSTSLELQSGVAQLTLGNIADLLHVDSVRIFEGTDSYDLEWKRVEELRTLLSDDSTSGTPQFWSREGDELLVYPTPNEDRVIAIKYAAAPAVLDDDTDVLVIPTLYVAAVVWGVVAIFAFRQRDWAGLQLAETARDSAVRRMERAYHLEQRQNSRQVKSGYWGRR